MFQIVWFKRDLRVEDHRALATAAEAGPVIPLYVVEPLLWREQDMSGRHWAFITESLTALRVALHACGQPLIVRMGDVTDVLESFWAGGFLTTLWSHAETGNGWTYSRDLRVVAWCRAHGVAWHELPNHGVKRRLKSRNGWARSWDKLMREAITPVPSLKPLDLDVGTIPTGKELGLGPDPCPDRQKGSRRSAIELLEGFLNERGETYRSTMSSPVEGESACSRLSPHLAWGTISMREVTQAVWRRQRALKGVRGFAAKNWRGSLSSFNGRLHWHCHFMQKLEDEPRIEFENLHRAYDGIRPFAPDHQRLDAWAKGETGLPFVDACMRYLRAGGWLNFRMRAMVMAVATYHLWLHWRKPGLELARLFTDYEPGIHWSQVQMQSGTTGINAVRIYNPVKQGHDQDPEGIFTRRWLPELAVIPDKFLQEPWKAENAGAVLGKTYPEPIVNHMEAAQLARESIWAVRRGPEFSEEARQIQNRHGSRKGRVSKVGPKSDKRNTGQLDLPLEESQG